VISYDLMAPDAFLREFLGPDIERVTFEEGDVTDRARLAEVARQNAVASIISAAAITPRVDRERREPQRIIDVNIGGVVNALEVARDLPDFRRFVQISSSAVFGDVPGATELDEDSPANATSLYGITKLAGERIALRYGDLFGLDVIAVRPSNVYGPMERVTPGYAGATELREMLRIHYAGKPIEVAALDAHYRDWTYAEDVAEGIERAWARPRRRTASSSSPAASSNQWAMFSPRFRRICRVCATGSCPRTLPITPSIRAAVVPFPRTVGRGRSLAGRHERHLRRGCGNTWLGSRPTDRSRRRGPRGD
jgi:nucleoside-diphosphate-sugar epimerase